jgi:hypothetical protein
MHLLILEGAFFFIIEFGLIVFVLNIDVNSNTYV